MPEEKLTRAERRRRERGIYPCAGGCGKRIKVDRSLMGFCKTCWQKLNPDKKEEYQMLLAQWREKHG